MESYQFIKRIGQCNYGDVWLVKCNKTRNKYVLKRIDLHRASKRDQRAAYLEAKFLSTLKHPNIVKYLDSFYNSKGNLFIVRGYCECGNFYSFIKNRNGAYFEEKEILNWFIQICMGLKYLHDKGILHRDLKTQNIFLTKNKLVKIGDLGIPQVLKAAEEMSTSFISIPYYMNPEVFVGKTYNQKTDVWALGCCMYEIAALQPLFVAQDMHTLMQKVLKGKIPSIPAISSEFFNIISSMLSPDPDKRPSVTELLLNEFVRKFIIHSLKESPPTLNSSSRACSRSTPSLADGPRPLSRLFAFGDNSSTHKVYKETENSTNTGTIRTVPDSNGNGDGNDNSQNQANHMPVLNICKNSESKISLNDIKTNDTNDNVSVKKHIVSYYNLRENNRSEVSSVTSSSSSTSTPSSNSEKLRNEKSFTLLNNLCYTIRQSRLKNWQFTGSGLFPDLPKVKYSYGDSPPKSAEELYFHSDRNRKELLKRCSLSAFEIHSHKRFGNNGQLPQITTDGLQVSTSSVCVVDKDKISLPMLENSQASSHNNNDDDKAIPWDSNTKDDQFDKLLIQNIMECNGAKQNGFAKSTVGQHRREILKLHETSSSTSIV